MTPSIVIIASALALSTAGCSQILGIGEPGEVDTDASPDGDPGSSGIRVTGGLTVFGAGANTGAFRIADQRLEFPSRVCTTEALKICVVGGITP